MQDSRKQGKAQRISAVAPNFVVQSPTNRQDTHESRTSLGKLSGKLSGARRKSIESILHSSYLNNSKLFGNDNEEPKESPEQRSKQNSRSIKNEKTIELESDEASDHSLEQHRG